MRRAEDELVIEPRGKITRFRQFGTVSVVVCIVVAIGTTLVEVGRGRDALLYLSDAVFIAVAVLLSTLTIEVDDIGLRWFFTGGLFGSRLTFDQIATMTTQRVIPLSFGYRVGFKKRAWLVTGRSVLVLQRADSEVRYMIGASDPEAVREEVERRWKR